jgi:ribosomal RNA methyltransferase Nop2
MHKSSLAAAATMTARTSKARGQKKPSPRKGNGGGTQKQQKKKIPSPTPAQESETYDSNSDVEIDHRQIVNSRKVDAKKALAKQSDSSESGSDNDNGDEQDKNGDATFFSDKNAAWLKPANKAKSKLLDSDDDDEGSSSDAQDVDQASGDKYGSDVDDEEDDDDELLDIEKDAQRLDDEIEAEQEEADEDMRLAIRDHTAIYHLPTAEEIEKNVDRVVPPSEIRGHIDSILEVLSEFTVRREPGRARKEYTDLLATFIAELYGYIPELIEYFLTMFSPAECLEFVDASDKPRPLVIRTNTLKTRRKDLAAALMKRGVSLDPLAAWSKVGLKIMESQVPIGATPEYLSGMYMLQSAASMCPVLALAPEPKERVLDMAAAPGGKTSYIAQLMRNTGVIFANDLKAERQKATVANMHRLGVKNVVACKHDGRKLGVLFKNRFDRILLDAPCSGLGVISRDPSVKVQRTIEEINQCSHLQKELILAAIDALKCKGTTGGFMVYSTCSVAVAENEEVVNYALSKRDIRIVESGLDFGTPGFTRYQQKRYHPSLALSRRFYPHVHNMDGFFVCKIQKLSDTRPGGPGSSNAEVNEEIELKPLEQSEDMGKNKLKSKSSQHGRKRKQHSGKGADKSVEKKSKISVPPSKRSIKGK